MELTALQACTPLHTSTHNDQQVQQATATAGMLYPERGFHTVLLVDRPIQQHSIHVPVVSDPHPVERTQGNEEIPGLDDEAKDVPTSSGSATHADNDKETVDASTCCISPSSMRR
jgi:hypothetical protein